MLLLPPLLLQSWDATLFQPDNEQMYIGIVGREDDILTEWCWRCAQFGVAPLCAKLSLAIRCGMR